MAKKVTVVAIISALLAIALLLGSLLLPKEPALPTYERTYVECMELMKEDAKTAVKRYVHYEDSDIAETAHRSAFEIDSYLILKAEQLTDNLWHFYTFVTHGLQPNGYRVHHFVGIIDNEYRVMFSIKQVPAFLSEGLDMTQYKNTDLEGL